jgi:hypothetical protein
MKEFYSNFVSENDFIIKYIDGSHYKSLFQPESNKSGDKQNLEFLKDSNTKKKKVEGEFK